MSSNVTWVNRHTKYNAPTSLRINYRLARTSSCGLSPNIMLNATLALGGMSAMSGGIPAEI